MGAGRLRVGFQFPVRNSVSLSQIIAVRLHLAGRVSIPRSEFCVFKLGPGYDDEVAYARVSIPRSEFCVFKL